MTTESNFQNPLNQITQAAKELNTAYEKVENALIPGNPNKQKRFYAWEKTKEKFNEFQIVDESSLINPSCKWE
jgi:signal recognition particle subunit SEC65